MKTLKQEDRKKVDDNYNKLLDNDNVLVSIC